MAKPVTPQTLNLPNPPKEGKKADYRKELLFFGESQNTTPEGGFRGVDDKEKLLEWKRVFAEHPELLATFGGLMFLRRVAMAVRNVPPPDEEAQTAAYYLASRWVRFLISDQASQEKFFLQEYVAKDQTLYELDRLRPKAPPVPWPDLPSLKTHQLTVTELELTLAVFTADAHGNVQFTWWLARYPHLLWRIHAFLLRRYCFPLLDLFHRAQRSTCKEGGEGNLDTPPFRAGEVWRLYPRIGALTFLGLLAIVGLTPALAFFFASHPVLVAAGFAACSAVQLFLAHIDVFKQNRGVMTSSSHAWPRVWRLSLRFFLWGLALAAGFLGACWLAQVLPLEKTTLRPLAGWENILLPALPPGSILNTLRLFLGFVGLATASGTLGALLQWIWEERAATEPI